MYFLPKIRLKIGPRIMGLVTVLLVLMIGCFWYALYKMKHIGRELHEVVNEDFPMVNLVTQITTHQLEQSIWLERALRYGEIIPAREKAKELLKRAEEEIKSKSRLVRKEIEKARRLANEAKAKVSTEEQRQAFKEIGQKLRAIEAQYAAYEDHLFQLFDELKQGNLKQAELLAQKIDQEVKELDQKLEEYQKKAEWFLKKSLASADNHEKEACTGLGIIGLVALIFGLATGGFIARGITTKLKELIIRLKDLATGEADLTKQLTVRAINCSQVIGCGNVDCPVYGKEARCWYEAGSYAPEVHCSKIKNGEYSSCEECKVYKQAMDTELDEVASLVNAFILRIRDLVAKVKVRGEEVAEEAQSLSLVSEQLASSAVEAQAQAEEVNHAVGATSESISSVATAMEEMTATVEEISQHTARANEVAQEASTEAARAQEVIRNLTEASNRISEVSKIIGSIAEQTKLLALNATIEAARAGEAGKGFAVVANEVKELAKQTTKATEEITQKLNAIQQESQMAMKAVNEITEIITHINEGASSIASAIEEHTAIMAEVSQKIAEQSASGDEVREKMATIKYITEEASEILSTFYQDTAQLKEAATRLEELVAKFKV